MEKQFAIRHSSLLLAAALTIALGACAKHEVRPSKAPASTTSTAPKPVHTVKAKPATMKPAAAPKAAVGTPTAMTGPDQNMVDAATGIPECDDYLGNYRACHAILGTQFSDINTQLSTLRASILDTARDKGNDAAKAKCVALVQQRDEALQGRSCK